MGGLRKGPPRLVFGAFFGGWERGGGKEDIAVGRVLKLQLVKLVDRIAEILLEVADAGGQNVSYYWPEGNSRPRWTQYSR